MREVAHRRQVERVLLVLRDLVRAPVERLERGEHGLRVGRCGDRGVHQRDRERIAREALVDQLDALAGLLVGGHRIPHAAHRQSVDEGIEVVVHAPRDRLVPDHAAPATDVVVVPARVHVRDLVAAGGVLLAEAAVLLGLGVVAHHDQRAVPGLPRGGRRRAHDAVRARADVAHRAAHAAVLPHHLDRAVVEGERRHAARALHVELLRDAADVLAVGAELAGVAEPGPDLLALAQRLVVGREHHEHGPRRVEREARPTARRPVGVAERPAVVADEPRHRLARRRRAVALGGHAALGAVGVVEEVVRVGDALLLTRIVDHLGRLPEDDLVAAVDRHIGEAVRRHVGVELGLQRGRRDHIGAVQRPRDHLLHRDRLALRLGDALVVVLERRQLLDLGLDLDGRVVLEEVDDVVELVEGARGGLRVDGRARIGGNHQLEPRAGRHVGQRLGGLGAVGVVPSGALRAARGVGVLQRERERELGVVAAHRVLAEVDLERPQREQHRQRVLAAAVDRVAHDRRLVDPGQEVGGQLDAPLAQRVERAAARCSEVGLGPHGECRGNRVGGRVAGCDGGRADGRIDGRAGERALRGQRERGERGGETSEHRGDACGAVHCGRCYRLHPPRLILPTCPPRRNRPPDHRPAPSA